MLKHPANLADVTSLKFAQNTFSHRVMTGNEIFAKCGSIVFNRIWLWCSNRFGTFTWISASEKRNLPKKKILTKISFFRSSDTIERISRAFAQTNTHRIELRKRYSSDRDLYFFVRPHTHASSLNSVGFHGNETHTSMVAFSAEQIQTYASWCYELLQLDRIPINI